LSEVNYTIDQVSQMVGVQKSTLRYWERVLHIETPRSHGNQRRYPMGHVELFKHIKGLYEEGLATRGVRMRLKEGEYAHKVA
jgi:DNA-binding transcriptional MerR regulator